MNTQGNISPADKELVERARRGEIAAFETLVRSHETKIFSFALNIAGGDHELAQDIMQDALIHAYRGISSFRGDCSFSSWLWRILKNDFLRYREHAAFSREEPDNRKGNAVDDHEPAVELVIMRQERLLLLRRLVAQMSIEDQEVITLIEFQELSVDEVAALTAMSIEAVKSRLHRARGRLTELVKKNKNLFS